MSSQMKKDKDKGIKYFGEFINNKKYFCYFETR